MSLEVHVPANFVSSSWGTPTVCARHGEPAVERTKVRFTTHTSPWFILLGVVVYFVVVAATRKTVSSPGWPFCLRCRREETTRTISGWGGLIVGILVWVGSVQLLGAAAPFGAITGIVLLVAGVILIGRGTGPAIAGGVVTDDGRAVRFARAHESFAYQTALAEQAAAQHYAAQLNHPPRPVTDR